MEEISSRVTRFQVCPTSCSVPSLLCPPVVVSTLPKMLTYDVSYLPDQYLRVCPTNRSVFLTHPEFEGKNILLLTGIFDRPLSILDDFARMSALNLPKKDSEPSQRQVANLRLRDKHPSDTIPPRVWS